MTEAFVQSLPLLDSGDVVIAGAGPAGLCAAVAAARQGARVILLERFGAVGGSLTVGHVRTCMGEIAAGTMQEEIGRLLGYGGACIPHDVERAKYVLSQWLEDNGVILYLQTPVAEVWKAGENVRGLVVSTPRGLARVAGRTTVDATRRRYGGRSGRGCLPDGAPSDRLVQPASLLFTIDRVHSDLVCTHEADDTMLDGVSYLQLCEQASRCGELRGCDHRTVIRRSSTG